MVNNIISLESLKKSTSLSTLDIDLLDMIKKDKTIKELVNNKWVKSSNVSSFFDSYQDILKDMIRRDLADIDFDNKKMSSIKNDIDAYKSINNNAYKSDNAIVIFVLGPSASGKSYGFNEYVKQLFIENKVKPRNIYKIDGGDFREKSVVYQTILKKIALQQGVSGYSDIFSKYWKTPSDNRKKQLVESAIAQKKSIVYPDTASNYDNINKTIQKFSSAGYKIFFLSIWSDIDTTRVQGITREKIEGKYFSSAAHLVATANMIRIYDNYMSKTDGGNKTFYCIDNSIMNINDLIVMKSSKNMNNKNIGRLIPKVELAINTAIHSAKITKFMANNHKVRTKLSGTKAVEFIKKNAIRRNRMFKFKLHNGIWRITTTTTKNMNTPIETLNIKKSGIKEVFKSLLSHK